MRGLWGSARGQARRRVGTSGWVAALATAGLVVTFGVVAPALVASPAAAATNALTLQVVSARTEPRALGGTGVTKGDAIGAFSYLVSVDNTGTTEQRSPAPGTGCASSDPDYPASCNWPSIQDVPHASTVYTHGDEGDFAGGATLDLPDGRYLISVLADGYKIDGVHVTMPLDSADPVVVALQPDPLPDGTLRAQVFADISPTDGTLDAGDPGLAHFVGHINDYLGLVTTDVYGNPLCTTYEGEDPDSHQIPTASLDADLAPVVDVPGGTCESDAEGRLTIPHLGSNRYTLSVTPPDGQTWIQTTTLEGNHDWDAWVMEGSTGFDTEFTLAGEAIPQPIFGFVAPNHDGQPLSPTATGHITGLVETIKAYTPPKGGSLDFWSGKTGTRADKPMPYPWLSLSDLQNGDQAVWVGKGKADGSFDIAGVPAGDYTLSWWDEPAELSARDDAGDRQGQPGRGSRATSRSMAGGPRTTATSSATPTATGSRIPVSRAYPTSRSPCAARRTRSWTAGRPRRSPTPPATTPSSRPTHWVSGPSWRPTATRSTPPASPTKRTTSHMPPPSRVQASTSAS